MSTKKEFDALSSTSQNNKLKRPLDYTGFYRGKVVDVEDPKKRGRVRVWIPDLMDGKIEDNTGFWVLPANNMFVGNIEAQDIGMDDCGSSFVPPKGAHVIIFFEDHDFNKPRYLCGLNLDNDAAVPVENQLGNEYWNKWTILKSLMGRQIFVSDDQSDPSVIIRGKYKNRKKLVTGGSQNNPKGGAGGCSKKSSVVDGSEKIPDRDIPRNNDKSDPRQPVDSQVIELWEKPGEEYVIMQDGKEQYVVLDEAKNVIRIQHVTGSFMEFRQDGDIILQAAKNIHMNSFSPNKKKHDRKISSGSGGG